MKKRNFYLFAMLFVISGCASMFMKGGSLVETGYQPKKVMVVYRAEGIVPAGAEYQLIETEKGTAIFERSPDGSGALFETHWTDKQGDHFAGWVATSHGYEFVIPLNRKKEAKKFFYPKGTYETKTIDDIERPVPSAAVDPVAKLIPIKK